MYMYWYVYVYNNVYSMIFNYSFDTYMINDNNDDGYNDNDNEFIHT